MIGFGRFGKTLLTLTSLCSFAGLCAFLMFRPSPGDASRPTDRIVSEDTGQPSRKSDYPELSIFVDIDSSETSEDVLRHEEEAFQDLEGDARQAVIDSRRNGGTTNFEDNNDN